MKTFAGADGLKVHQGSHSNMDSQHTVFYCNDVCAAVDWEVNRENINKQDNRPGNKPIRKANYWVQSKAAVVARKMLRAAVQKNELPDLDSILKEIRVQRGIGAQQNVAIRRTLPDEKDVNGDMGLVEKQKVHIRKGAMHDLEEVSCGRRENTTPTLN